MNQYSSITEMAQEYAKMINTNLEAHDQWNAESVAAVIVENVVRPTARHLYSIDSHIKMIPHFGYVEVARFI